MSFYPFGLQLCDGTTDSNVQSHRYNGKELDKMHGLNTYDYGARQYNPVTARWDRIDPLCEKYYSISPYAYCANNPVKYVDPDGRQLGDFVDEDGKVIGNDGIDDGIMYVIKTRKTIFREVNEKNGVAGAGNTKYNETVKFVKNSSGNTMAFKDNKIAYENSCEIEPDKTIRKDMVEHVENGDKKNAYKEYGGELIKRLDGSTESITKEEGSEGDPRTGGQSIYLDTRKSTYHGHGSGSVAGYSFIQHPSQQDVDMAGNMSNYVFGMRDGNTYIYNKKCIQAVLPTKFFVNPQK